MELNKEYYVEFNGTYDIVFKRLFQKSEVAARVIENIINCKINPDELHYIDSAQSNGVNLKNEMFDITIEIVDPNKNYNRYLDLEMQRSKKEYHLSNRLFINLAALTTNNMRKGVQYGNREYYSICFVNYPLETDECVFELFKDHKEGVTCAQIYLVDLTKLWSCDKLQLKEILEIVKSNTILLKDSEDEVVKLAKETIFETNQDKILRNQLRLQQNAEMDREWQEAAVRQKAETEGMAKGMAEGMAKGMAEGMAKGMAKGIAEGTTKGMSDAIKALHSSGMSVEEISTRLCISAESVEEMLKL